jgi:hypothetical protein
MPGSKRIAVVLACSAMMERMWEVVRIGSLDDIGSIVIIELFGWSL